MYHSFQEIPKLPIKCKFCYDVLFFIFKGQKVLDYTVKYCKRCKSKNNILFFKGRYYFFDELLKHQKILKEFQKKYTELNLHLLYIDDIFGLIRTN